VLIRDGGVIAPGYNQDLDDLRNLSQNAAQFLIDMETKEKAATGITNLKVNYNRVHGYYMRFPTYTLKKYRHITPANRP